MMNETEDTPMNKRIYTGLDKRIEHKRELSQRRVKKALLEASKSYGPATISEDGTIMVQKKKQIIEEALPPELLTLSSRMGGTLRTVPLEPKPNLLHADSAPVERGEPGDLRWMQCTPNDIMRLAIERNVKSDIYTALLQISKQNDVPQSLVNESGTALLIMTDGNGNHFYAEPNKSPKVFSNTAGVVPQVSPITVVRNQNHVTKSEVVEDKKPNVKALKISLTEATQQLYRLQKEARLNKSKELSNKINQLSDYIAESLLEDK